MTIDKHDLSERDICTKFITPAIIAAGWEQAQFREEVNLTDGRVLVQRNLATRVKDPDAKGGPKRADYVLYARPDIPSYIDTVIRSDMTREVIRKVKNSTNDNILMGDTKGFAIPLPPLTEQRRIVAKVDQLMLLVDQWEAQLKKKSQLAERFAKAAIAAFTGIHAAPEEAPMKPPLSELDAPLRLGKNLKPADQDPLASILARHHGTLQAKDLWQRFGGDIAVFYAQLKREAADGWITEPQPAVMLVREAV